MKRRYGEPRLITTLLRISYFKCEPKDIYERYTIFYLPNALEYYAGTCSSHSIVLSSRICFFNLPTLPVINDDSPEA